MTEREAAPRNINVLAERRIAWLTLVIGALAAAIAAVALSPRAGVGVAAGALLAWINFRWLQQALDAVVKLSTAQADAPKPQISKWVWIRLFLRYVLIGGVVYVMMSRFNVPVLSILGGLLALGAATMAESIYEILFRAKAWKNTVHL